MMPSAASAPCSLSTATGGGSSVERARAPAASRRRRARRSRPAPRRGARPTARLRAARPPARSRRTRRCRRCDQATAVDQAGQRQRGQHVRALVAAGARQEIGDQDRRHQPGEHADFERARHAAQGDIDRESGERGEAAEQARRNEGAMARRRQRILLRRRMHQRIDIVPHWREETHGPCLTSC